MNKINYDDLKQFDLTFPGHWIKGDDRDQASQTKHILGFIQGLLTEAVVSYALFQPITAENHKDFMARFESGDESPYERCLNGLYAKAFVFALDGIEKLLNRLSGNLNPPKEVNQLHEEYKKYFGHLKHIRDSAIHIEDRGRGVTRKGKRLKTSVVILGCFNEKRYTFTGDNGLQYEIEISDTTVNTAKSIIQKIINSYPWM
ncbi:MAG: hypothetical protein EHM54_05435 [Nitrospiraceae bacterium]|nr:MAG: hypothetical protein EHM54_05435 [Nitrospiraceae bacterium]